MPPILARTPDGVRRGRRPARCAGGRARGRCSAPGARPRGCALSAPSIASATWAAVSPWSTAILAATRISSGPVCSVRRWMIAFTSGSDSIAARIAAVCSGTALSPTSIEDISSARNTAITSSSEPIASAPMPSQRASPVTHRERDADEREAQADERAEVLEQDHRAARADGHRARTAPSTSCRGSCWPRGSPYGRRTTRARSRCRGRERDLRAGERLGIVDLVPALVEAEQATEAEQHDRDDERVDVAHAAVAELVLLVGLALANAGRR